MSSINRTYSLYAADGHGYDVPAGDKETGAVTVLSSGFDAVVDKHYRLADFIQRSNAINYGQRIAKTERK